jgi:hypothetical protein
MLDHLPLQRELLFDQVGVSRLKRRRMKYDLMKDAQKKMQFMLNAAPLEMV